MSSRPMSLVSGIRGMARQTRPFQPMGRGNKSEEEGSDVVVFFFFLCWDEENHS